MVGEQIKSILAQYDVIMKEESAGRSLFIHITDSSEPKLYLILHMLDDRLYSIIFLNTEFFELSDEDLSLVLRCILDGHYFVKKPFLFGKPSIYIREPNREAIVPERINNKDFTEESLALYQVLPRAFTRKVQ